ncbi:hypothetical protein G6Z92_06495 [Vibrio aestuarianus subsp. cardii]|uniref:hypothetical protein n=1 Tax=Vibrio aestuarianus TaxID=28171 RepID=UPI0015C5454C|nr:hypothetical protein [Vibrio aestuarianus]NGZ66635.1 hypothetical protein [Vibrio aestuarianus subsp. cardii]
MAGKLKVIETKYGQEYGMFSYNKELGSGNYILKKHSNRKNYPDVLSRNRTEECILDAISNYRTEINIQRNSIRDNVSIQIKNKVQLK